MANFKLSAVNVTDDLATQARTFFGDNLNTNLEGSGIAYHTGEQKIIVLADSGYIRTMNYDGGGVTAIVRGDVENELLSYLNMGLPWMPALFYPRTYSPVLLPQDSRQMLGCFRLWARMQNVEDICIPNNTGSLAYVIQESPETGIFEIWTGANGSDAGVVRRYFDLNSVISSSAHGSNGAEAIAFVADSSHAEGGTFYVSVQRDPGASPVEARTYIFSLPLVTDTSSITVTVVTPPVSPWIPEDNKDDIGASYYSPEENVVYTMWDADDDLDARNPADMSLIKRWDERGAKPAIAQEGLTLKGDDIVFSNDNGAIPADPGAPFAIVFKYSDWRHGSLNAVGGIYADGTIVSLVATPSSGYKVKTWTGTNNDASTSRFNSVTMSADKVVTVEFEVGEQVEEAVVGGNFGIGSMGTNEMSTGEFGRNNFN